MEDEILIELRKELDEERHQLESSIRGAVSDYYDLKDDLLYRKMYLLLDILNLTDDEFQIVEDFITQPA
jgi:hypothetical protein